MTDVSTRAVPASAADPRAAAEAASGPAARPGTLTRPLARGVFWTASLLALLAVAVAIVGGTAAGWHGVVLLSGVAGVALLLMYALAAGEAAGRALGPDARIAASAAADAWSLPGAALEALAEPMMIAAADGRPVWANAAYRGLAGADPRADAAIAPPEDLFAGAGAGAVYRLSRAAAQGERRRETLGRLGFGRDGASVYVGEVAPMAGGGAVWRFHVPRALDGAADAAPEWAELAPVGLFLADAEGRVLAANATLRGWIGADADQALKVKDFLAGDAPASFSRTRGVDGPARLEARLILREGVESPAVLAVSWGEERPALARCVVYGLSAAGAPPGHAQIAAASGARAGRTFDDMFASAPFGVARLDAADPMSAMIEDANPALLHLSGGAAVPGARFADLFQTGEGDSLADVFDRALSGGGEPGETRMKGAEKAVHVFLAPARGGKRAAYVVDVTAWKALEAQFAQAGKMQAVGQLASGVAHDFNNMLTAIRLNVGELLNRHPVGDPSYQDLQQINSTVTRQAGLVRKLLAFSRKQTFRMTVFDISDVLSDCSVMLGQILEETVKLQIRHGRDLPLIRADRNQIDNVLVNLATNARDAMRDNGGGTLTITTEAVDAAAVRAAGAPGPKEGEWAAIHVADTGCGMPEEVRAKIFEPFFTTKEAGQGTGLGLATVYGVVKQSGGYLFVQSEVGVGTTFSIYLPGHVPSAEETAEIAAEAQARTVEPKPADLAGYGRILLVEDEDAVRSIAAKTLARRGYDVVEASDGEEALEILEQNPGGFDLLVSDVVMPGLDGPGLLKQGRKHLGSARVIFISGYAEEEFSHTLSSDLEISFLPKPFDIQQLAERVKQELAAARS